jgi:hypothetical protein
MWQVVYSLVAMVIVEFVVVIVEGERMEEWVQVETFNHINMITWRRSFNELGMNFLMHPGRGGESAYTFRACSRPGRGWWDPTAVLVIFTLPALEKVVGSQARNMTRAPHLSTVIRHTDKPLARYQVQTTTPQKPQGHRKWTRPNVAVNGEDSRWDAAPWISRGLEEELWHCLLSLNLCSNTSLTE